MSSSAYINIQRKLSLQGKEYFEGFDPQDFYGLSETERSDVVATLVARSRRGDGVSFRALAHILAPAEYIEFAESLLATWPKRDLFGSELATEVFNRTHKDSVLDTTLDLLRSGDVFGKQWILNNLSYDVLTATQSGRVVEALKNIVRTEKDSGLLLAAAVNLLSALGFTPRSAEFIRLAKILRDRNQVTRNRALDELAASSRKDLVRHIG
jgi:hypothetical protein